MDRRQFLFNSSLAIAGTALPLKNILSFRLDSFTDIRRNVGYYTERGGTIGWLATNDAFVIIDSQFPESARACLAGLEKKTGHQLDALINTHHHGDHTGGNSVFREKAGLIVAHDNVPELMKLSSDEGSEPAYPNKTFEKSWRLEAGDETVHATHYGPAHTGGDSVIYFEQANVVHMGDLVFNRMNPYTDRPAGASIHNWINVLETVAAEYPSDAIYIFGHGNPEFGVTGSRKDLYVLRDYFTAMIEHVENGIEAGKTRENITALEKLEEFPQFQYADWWTLSQNLEVVHDEIMEMK